MEKLEIVWRFLVASIAVWRLSQLLFGETESAKESHHAHESSDDSAGARFWVQRVLDLLCWISVSLSSQTAMWVACGFAGVFCSWLTLAGVSRFFTPASPDEEACVSCGDGMQAHHG